MPGLQGRALSATELAVRRRMIGEVVMPGQVGPGPRAGSGWG
jgi:hypothetical protein